VAAERTANSEPVVRRFTLLDAMVLIAASAPGIYHIVRNCLDDPVFGIRTNKIGTTLMVLCHYLHMVVPLMGLMTIALLIARFRRPRPSVARIFREPGMVACFAALAVALLELVAGFAQQFVVVFDSVDGSRPAFFREIASMDLGEVFWTNYWGIPPRIGQTIGVLWLVQIASRHGIQIGDGSTGRVELSESSGWWSRRSGGFLIQGIRNEKVGGPQIPSPAFLPS
jgi:hypothetical protein